MAVAMDFSKGDTNTADIAMDKAPEAMQVATMAAGAANS